MANKRILYISQEIAPYLAESPLSKLGRDLPQKIQEKGYEVRTFMPKYGCINERRNQLHEVIRLSGLNISIDDNDHPLIIKVATLLPTRMQVYFIDNDDYFLRAPQKELETVLSPHDNDERIIFFTRGVIETVKKFRWEPAIIQATGWVTALAPLFIRRMYPDDPTFVNAKVVYALSEDSFDDTLDARFAEKLEMLNFAKEDISSLGTEAADIIALNKLAIDHSDAVILTSDNLPQVLIDYALQSGKPVLESALLSNDGFEELYSNFYNSLLE